MRQDALDWISDEMELAELPDLERWISSFKWGYAVERLVEGDHANIHRSYGRARAHCESYDSLTRRMGELKAIIASKEGMESILECLARARSPHRAAISLGFAHHPALEAQNVGSGWDPLFRQLVYRSDPFSMYSVPTPHLQIGPPPSDPPPAPPLPLVDALVDAVDAHGSDGEASGHVTSHVLQPATGEVVAAACSGSQSQSHIDKFKKHYAIKLLAERLPTLTNCILSLLLNPKCITVALRCLG